MKQSLSYSTSATSRIGPILSVLAVLAFDALTPDRYRLVPTWFPMLAAAIMLGSMLASVIARGRQPWKRVERWAMMIVILSILGVNALNLINVVLQLLWHGSEVRAAPLAQTSLALWSANALAFTLLYWEIDRGGPDKRASATPGYVDFDFPAYDDPSKVPPGWMPTFVDYFFLGFTTSTAFSPTEAMPLSARAKGLMILQSTISLITIVAVAARVINIMP